MQIEKVRLEDVYPDERNPRSKFEGVDEMAESISVTGGEPLTPIIVLRDGGIYRIVDGERRYRAMRKLGTRVCSALVVDDWDEADVALAMVATDDKQPLTELERSRGLQQMLITGVPVEKAAKAARVRKATVMAVNNAMQIVGDAVEDMTTERLVWIAEHPGITADELASVENAAEKDWRRVADGIEAEHRMAGLVAAKVAELEARGITCVAEEPDRDDGWFYVPEKDACPACVAHVEAKPFYSKPIVYFHCRDAVAHGRAENPEAAAAKAEAERIADEQRALDRADAELRTADVMGICKQEDIDSLLEEFARWYVPYAKANMWQFRDMVVPDEDEWKLPALAACWMEWRIANPGNMEAVERAHMYSGWVAVVNHAAGYNRELTPNEQRRLDEAQEVLVAALRETSKLPDPDPEDIEEVGF